MNDEMYSLLERRRDSAIKIILRLKERECDPYLPKEASHALRKVVLDQINETHEVVVSLLKAYENSEVAVNDYWLERLEEIHEAVVGNGSTHPF